MTTNITDSIYSNNSLTSVFVGNSITDVNYNVLMFRDAGTTTYSNSNVSRWVKPKGCKFIHIYAVGGGSGGAGGTAYPPGYFSSGGGGGPGGLTTKALIPAFLVPDVLYVHAGDGGMGGSGGYTNGVNVSSPSRGFPGTPSFVCMYPDYYNTTTRLVYTNYGGSSNIGSSSNYAQPASNPFGVHDYVNKSYGLEFNTYTANVLHTGDNYSVGQASPGWVSTIVAFFDSSVISNGTAAGAGGGGCTPSGSHRGGFSMQMDYNDATSVTNYSSLNIVLSGSFSGNDGLAGIGLGFNPYLAKSSVHHMNFLGIPGGSGGGGNINGNGGRGGDGSFGSGGGGGGGTAGTNVFGGNGGNGGPGFVIITAIM